MGVRGEGGSEHASGVIELRPVGRPKTKRGRDGYSRSAVMSIKLAGLLVFSLRLTVHIGHQAAAAKGKTPFYLAYNTAGLVSAAQPRPKCRHSHESSHATDSLIHRNRLVPRPFRLDRPPNRVHI